MKPTPSSLEEIVWPLSHAADALRCLAQAHGLLRDTPLRDTPRPSSTIVAQAALRREWIERLGSWLGVEVTAVDEAYPRLTHLLQHAAPALLAVTLDAVPYLVAIAGSSRKQLCVIDPQGRMRSTPLGPLRQALAAAYEADVLPAIDRLLSASQLSAAARQRATRALLHERLAQQRVGDCWLLRRAQARPWASAVAATKLPTWLARTLGLYALQYALLGLAWHAATQGALLGSVQLGWLLAWLLALASSVPIQGVVSWLSARFSIDAGAWLRDHLINAILRLDPEQVRRDGSGQLLVRVIEAGVLEALGLSGGLAALFAAVDLLMAGLLFSNAIGGTALLIVWSAALGVAAWAIRHYLQRRRTWTATRLELTQTLIESMVGQRTRVAQQSGEQRHELEDDQLDRYLEASRRLDRVAIGVSFVPRLAFLLSLACLAAMLWSAAPSPIAFALAIGGAVLASRGLGGLLAGLHQLSAAAIAWQYVAPLVRLPASDETPAHPTTVCGARARSPRGIFEARGLTLQHPAAPEPILAGVDLTIEAGENLLLEGESGCGKSTLAHVLAGLRPVARGLLMFNGLDRSTLGAAGWSRRVTVAPQFHDNHVLGGTLAFNALLGRNWPPEAGDLELAETVCRELGLGGLLDRMPAGLHQQLGDTGWQLSHGERSRLFAARAILADADLAVLDESIAALDPETAEAVLRCARARTRSLMLIAHP